MHTPPTIRIETLRKSLSELNEVIFRYETERMNQLKARASAYEINVTSRFLRKLYARQDVLLVMIRHMTRTEAEIVRAQEMAEGSSDVS